MTVDQIALLLLLCVINYPFVLAMEWSVRRGYFKPVYDVPVLPEQRRREIRNALHTTPMHPAIIALCILTGAARIGPETAASVLATFAITFVWTEIYHYGLHRAMHLKAFHFTHREHHRSRITNAWTSISFSLWEEFLFAVGVMAFLSALSWIHPISLYGVVAYYLLYFSTNTIGHANVEYNAPGHADTFFGKIFTTSAYHAMHHARYINNYGLLTPFMDRLFRTEWADSAQVQTRAAQGQPLKALKERYDRQDEAQEAGDPALEKSASRKGLFTT